MLTTFFTVREPRSSRDHELWMLPTTCATVFGWSHLLMIFLNVNRWTTYRNHIATKTGVKLYDVDYDYCNLNIFYSKMAPDRRGNLLTNININLRHKNWRQTSWQYGYGSLSSNYGFGIVNSFCAVFAVLLCFHRTKRPVRLQIETKIMVLVIKQDKTNLQLTLIDSLRLTLVDNSWH